MQKCSHELLKMQTNETFVAKRIWGELFYLGKIKDEYIVPTNNTNGDATRGMVDNGSL